MPDWQNKKMVVLSIRNSSPNCIIGCENSYVCEHARNWSCSDQDNNSISLDGNCYVFHHGKRVNWFEAYFGCEKNNGRLATFKNLKENAGRIVGQLQNGREYWIGLYRQEWRWTDSNELLKLLKLGQSVSRFQSFLCVCSYRVQKNGSVWRNVMRVRSHSPALGISANAPTTHVIMEPPVLIQSTTTYVLCAPGFTGSDCQTDINECESNPCRNGSICLDSVSRYTCLCAPGFTGLQCHTNINPCENNSCQNGATCSDSDRPLHMSLCVWIRQDRECQTTSTI